MLVALVVQEWLLGEVEVGLEVLLLGDAKTGLKLSAAW